MLTIQRKGHLSSLAESIVEDYFPQDQIIPEVLAEKNNISFSYNHYGNSFDGLLELERSRKEFHIYFNLNRLKSPNSPRARFTFCHELAHFYIDEHRNAMLNGTSLMYPSKSEFESKAIVEQEADFFASNLLMPPSRFIVKAKKSKIGFQGIESLANYYGASITSTAVRYVELNLIPCILFKWDRKGALDWIWRSDDFKQAGLGKTHSKKTVASLVRNSSTEKALLGMIPDNGNFFMSGTTISYWFPYVCNNACKNEILIEQAFPLGNFGVLTLLFSDSGKFDFLRFLQ